MGAGGVGAEGVGVGTEVITIIQIIYSVLLWLRVWHGGITITQGFQPAFTQATTAFQT